MKKLALIIGGVSLLGAGGALAAISCTSAPSCATLGYTSTASSCGGDYLTCPFDTSKVYCIQCPEQCTELGYNKVASNGTYTCSDGQTISKCPQNKQKYKCDGTACSYGYYTYSKLPACEYEVCCDQRATYGNTNCYQRKNNTSYKKYTYDYAQCQAAAYSNYGDLPYVGLRVNSSSGNYKDACGNNQYTVKYYCMEYDNMSGSSSSNCGWSQQTCTNKTWHYGGYDDSGYQSDCMNNPCYQAWEEEQWGGDGRYEYNGEYMGFSEYCYKKYNLHTSCGGLKFMGKTIPYDFDYRGY